MIVRMAKILLTGPKELILEVLSVVQLQGTIHIDPQATRHNATNPEQCITTLTPSDNAVQERVFLEKLLQHVNHLLALLPSTTFRPSYINPESALRIVTKIISAHLEQCQTWSTSHETAKHKLHEMNKYQHVLQAVLQLVPDRAGFAALAVVGVKIADMTAFHELQLYLQNALTGFIQTQIVETSTGESFALIVTEKTDAKRLRAMLRGHHVTELNCPEDDLAQLPWTEMESAVAQRMAEYEKTSADATRQLLTFGKQWGGIYHNLRDWLQERLAVLDACTLLLETGRCFLIYGWMPSRDIAPLKRQLATHFAGKVLLEEMEVREHDLERIPIVLQNQGYFKPFELFSRLLPLPNYSSFDITPYIAIFFPIFFGMMLGDVGYGLIIMAGALILFFSTTKARDINDAAKILLVSACYTMIFGLLYGEFFGAVGNHYFGLHPLFFERQTALIPMLLFSASLGIVHVVIGLFLGMLTAFKKDQKREAIFKLFCIFIIFCLMAAVGIYANESLVEFRGSIKASLLGIIVVLLFTGGVLAPLEVLKHFGSIISYTRIMAIGLTSVLLAEVANQLAGMMGSVWVGLFVALLLHAFNILLGVFAPTIHALRLHYVEFFSKFMEAGGIAFAPLTKTKKGARDGDSNHVG